MHSNHFAECESDEEDRIAIESNHSSQTHGAESIVSRAINRRIEDKWPGENIAY